MLTVTTKASSYSLTTLAAAKAELGITDDSSDGALTAAIARASAAIASHCNRVFAQETVTETFRQQRQPWPSAASVTPLILSRLPVAEIQSVTEDGATLAAIDYECDAEKGLLNRLRDDCWVNWCARKIVVVYSAGWILPSDDPDAPAATLPDDLQQACLETVKSLWFSSGEEARDPRIRSDSVQGIGATSWTDPGVGGSTGIIPASAAGILDPYRLPTIF